MGAIPQISMFSDLIPMFSQEGEFDKLPQEQKEIAEKMINEAQISDLYTALGTAARAVNELGKIVGGLHSDDFDIEYDPSSGRTSINEKAKLPEAEAEGSGDGLPDPTGYTAEMGLYIRDAEPDGGGWADPLGGTVVKQGTPSGDSCKVWVVDWLRSIPTEEEE